MLTVAILLLAAVLAAGAYLLWRELGRRRRDANVGALLATFASAVARAEEDPRELVAWYPLAAAARRLFPDAFRELDAAAGHRFPFTPDHVQAAHDRCTKDWLSWERAHDFEYKLKAVQLEEELERRGERQGEAGRARLEAISREQLERYQERYAEYKRLAKALAGLEPPDRSA